MIIRLKRNKILFAVIVTTIFGLTGCKSETDDSLVSTLASVPGCDSQGDSAAHNPNCLTDQPSAIEYEYKQIPYTTANGLRSDGRYGYWPADGVSQEEAEAQAKALLQYNNDHIQHWVDWELSEVAYFLGNPCGDSWTLSNNLKSITVTEVRQGVNRNVYDYDLLLTCFRPIID